MASPASPANAAPLPKPETNGDERPETYTIKRGDTLYSIALDAGLDYRELADWNGIPDPAVIHPGQVLKLRAPAEPVVQAIPMNTTGAVEARPLDGVPQAATTQPAGDTLKTGPKAVKLPYSEANLALLKSPQAAVPQPKAEMVKAAPKVTPATPAPVPSAVETGSDKVDWGWPASGKVIAEFSEASNKGVDIGGKIGDPVFASAPGRVVYSGSGLRGYGRLVIIKHNATFLSAYAHNSNVLVKEGQTVARGQKIAEIGNTDSDRAKLHFEIRRLGKPVDPLKYLERRS